jgi:outer membrane lipoprotein carrier protein
LFGSGSLDQNFELAERPSAAGIDWLRATPRGADAGFSYVDIGFRDALPVRLEILDSFGQSTRIDLSNINVHPKLGAKEFTFTPPDGVDVVSMQ